MTEIRTGLENVKVAYRQLMGLLMDSKQKKVATIFEDALEMCQMKKRSRNITSHIKDVTDKVVAIKCGYFDRWMPLVGDEAVEFGIKNGTGTGLNPMCKIGLALDTKQKTAARVAHLAILDQVGDGTIEVTEVKALRQAVEDKKALIVDTKIAFATDVDEKGNLITLEDEVGYADKAEVIEYLEENDVELPKTDDEGGDEPEDSDEDSDED